MLRIDGTQCNSSNSRTATSTDTKGRQGKQSQPPRSRGVTTTTRFVVSATREDKERKEAASGRGRDGGGGRVGFPYSIFPSTSSAEVATSTVDLLMFAVRHWDPTVVHVVSGSNRSCSYHPSNTDDRGSGGGGGVFRGGQEGEGEDDEAHWVMLHCTRGIFDYPDGAAAQFCQNVTDIFPDLRLGVVGTGRISGGDDDVLRCEHHNDGRFQTHIHLFLPQQRGKGSFGHSSSRRIFGGRVDQFVDSAPPPLLLSSTSLQSLEQRLALHALLLSIPLTALPETTTGTTSTEPFPERRAGGEEEHFSTTDAKKQGAPPQCCALIIESSCLGFSHKTYRRAPPPGGAGGRGGMLLFLNSVAASSVHVDVAHPVDDEPIEPPALLGARGGALRGEDEESCSIRSHHRRSRRGVVVALLNPDRIPLPRSGIQHQEEVVGSSSNFSSDSSRDGGGSRLITSASYEGNKSIRVKVVLKERIQQVESGGGSSSRRRTSSSSSSSRKRERERYLAREVLSGMMMMMQEELHVPAGEAEERKLPNQRGKKKELKSSAPFNLFGALGIPQVSAGDLENPTSNSNSNIVDIEDGEGEFSEGGEVALIVAGPAAHRMGPPPCVIRRTGGAFCTSLPHGIIDGSDIIEDTINNTTIMNDPSPFREQPLGPSSARSQHPLGGLPPCCSSSHPTDVASNLGTRREIEADVDDNVDTDNNDLLTVMQHPQWQDLMFVVSLEEEDDDDLTTSPSNNSGSSSSGGGHASSLLHCQRDHLLLLVQAVGHSLTELVLENPMAFSTDLGERGIDHLRRRGGGGGGRTNSNSNSSSSKPPPLLLHASSVTNSILTMIATRPAFYDEVLQAILSSHPPPVTHGGAQEQLEQEHQTHHEQQFGRRIGESGRRSTTLLASGGPSGQLPPAAQPAFHQRHSVTEGEMMQLKGLLQNLLLAAPSS